MTLRHDAQTRLTEIAEAIDEVLYVEEHYADGSDRRDVLDAAASTSCSASARTIRCPTGGPTSTPRTVRSRTSWTPKLRQLIGGRRRVPADRRRRRACAGSATACDRVCAPTASIIAEGILADVTAEKEALLALEAARAGGRPAGPRRSAHRRVQPPPLLRGARVGAGPRRPPGHRHRPAGDRHRPLQGPERPPRPRRRRRGARPRRRAHRRRAARLRHARALGRRGVRRAAARASPAATTCCRRASASARRSRTRRPLIRGSRFPLTVSVGAASNDPRDADPAGPDRARRPRAVRRQERGPQLRRAARRPRRRGRARAGRGAPRPDLRDLGRRPRGHAAEPPRGRRRAVVPGRAASCGCPRSTPSAAGSPAGCTTSARWPCPTTS